MYICICHFGFLGKVSNEAVICTDVMVSRGAVLLIDLLPCPPNLPMESQEENVSF